MYIHIYSSVAFEYNKADRTEDRVEVNGPVCYSTLYNGLDRESNCRLRDPDPTLILNRILDTVVLKFKSKDKKTVVNTK